MTAARLDSERGTADLGHQQMDALGPYQRVRRAGCRSPVPGTGRPMDRRPPNGAGADVESRAGHFIRRRAALGLAVAQQQFFRRDIIGDRRAMRVGIHQIFQRDAFGHVHLGIVIFKGAFQAIARQHRFVNTRGQKYIKRNNIVPVTGKYIN